jgi:hypothetical protein
VTVRYLCRMTCSAPIAPPHANGSSVYVDVEGHTSTVALAYESYRIGLNRRCAYEHIDQRTRSNTNQSS